MAELFILAFLGHLIGDYLLQPNWMAIGKSKKDWRGFWVCTAHVTLYTTAVCAMMQVGNPFIWVLVFVPHWVIDHWSLGEAWSKFIGGRTAQKTMMTPVGVEREFAFAFYAPVYIAVDNTWHFVCLWATIKYFIL